MSLNYRLYLSNFSIPSKVFLLVWGKKNSTDIKAMAQNKDEKSIHIQV
jgi:hypothetical protein